MPEWFSILPPLLAIAIAVWRKEVIFALTLGIWLAEVFLAAASPGWSWPAQALAWPIALVELAGLGFTGMLERCVLVFQSDGNTRVLLFGLIVGALLELMQESGGVSAFVRKLANMGLTKSPRQVSMLPTVIGTLIFVETSMSVLASGVVSQKLFDQFKLSRARLAFLVDSTCAPISVLFLFLNGWGAYVLGLLEPYSVERPVGVIVGSVFYNFYPILILILVWYTVATTRVHGPMRTAEQSADETESEIEIEEPTKARYMLLPLIVLIGGMIGFMFLTGKGDFFEGSGSKSVLWAVSLSLFSLIVLLVANRAQTHQEIVSISYRGIGKLVPVVMIMLLSFAIGDSCKQLGTGPFVAGFVGEFLPVFLIAPLLFISAGVISFTTGTSWGTFAILVPVGIPLALALDIPPAFYLSAILGGGVFGDHCSPISDTTIISSLASGCDHMEHVKTQLPYALTAGSVAIALYLMVGLFL